MSVFAEGIKLYTEKNYIGAKECFEQALIENPNNHIIYHNLGVVNIQLKNNELATEYLQFSCNANYSESFISRGAAYRNLGMYQKALQDFATAFAIDPDHAIAYSNYSNTLREFGKNELALDFIKIALRLNPNDNTTNLNESVTHLAMGNFHDGWKKYDYRWFYETGESLKPDLPGTEYDGTQDIKNKVVLVYCEQGFGDCIQFVRYITLLTDAGAYVSLLTKPNLVELFRYNYPNTNVIDWGNDIPNYHYHVALLDLPKCFNTTIDTIPSPTAYLSVDEGMKNHWRQILGPKTKHRVGIIWTSNGAAYNTKFRKMDLETLLNVTSDDFEFISLHFDPTDEERKLLANNNVRQLELGNFYSTAGLISILDCVITVDTVTAHLSGSLGVNTFVMLNNYGCDWRWFQNRTDSPFYANMKLFRKEGDSWDSVIQHIKTDLILLG